MFLILRGETTEAGASWSVVPNLVGVAARPSTRELAEKMAAALAKEHDSLFAVVKVESWFEQETVVTVKETRIG